ncbi:MAG: hypothetical protein AAGH40_03770, partial [Verrucomicrobiota bacterium]
DIESGTGHITAKANTDIDLAADVDVTTATPGTVSFDAETGALTMNGTVNVTATNSSLRLKAAGDVTVGNVTAANVSIVSGEDVVNAAGSTKNVTATNLRIEATGNVGVASRHLTTNIDNLSVLSTTGSIYVTEDDAATIREVSVTVTDFNSDATTSPVIDAAQSDLETQLNGNIVLVATLGNITLNDGTDADDDTVIANGSGNILIDALVGSVLINEDVASGTGQITVKAGVDIDLAAAVDVTTSTPGTVSFDAETGALTMDGTANIVATDSSARLRAAGDVTVGNVTATNVSIVSGEDVVNAAGSTKNVTATNLRIEATVSVGVASRHLTTNIDNLSVLSTTGSIYITEDDAVIVTNVAVTVTDFNSDATTATVNDAAQSDLETQLNGNIVLVATLGNITLNDGTDADDDTVIANGSGNILIDALAGSIFINEDIESGTGHITAKANTDIDLAAAVDVTTATPGTVSFDAETGVLTMDGTANVTATNSSLRLKAAGDVTVGNVSATNVSIVSGEDVVNAAGSTKNVTATNLRIEATGSVGVASRHLTTNIDNLSVLSTTGSIYITEDDAVTVTNVAVTVIDFNSDTTTTDVTDAAQSDLETQLDGNIVLVATLGNITLNDGTDADDDTVIANGSGSILIDALAGSVFINEDIESGTGQITVKAGVDIDLAAAVDVTTATLGTVSFDAETGALTMNGTANVTATNSSLRLKAAGDVTVGNVIATNVSIVSGEDVVNADGSTKNVTATNLRIEATGSVGVASRHLTTNIDNLSVLSTTGSIYITEDDAVTVTNVVVTVTDFNSDATTTDVTDAAQSDLETQFNGNIILVATLGDITLDDGSDAGNDTVIANGSGNILIDALAGSVIGNADIHSASGSISVLADTNVTFNVGADITTGSSGSIDFEATNGLITLAVDSQQTAVDGSIRFLANGNITLGGLISTNTVVSLISSNGSILDGDTNDALDIDAAGLRVDAIQLAEGANLLEIDVDQFAANVTTGGIYVSEQSAVVVGTVSLSVERVATDGTTSTITDTLLTGAVATTGEIEISAGQDLTIETVQTLGDVTLTSVNGAILDGGDTATDIIADSLTLTANSGLGATGSGGLEVDLSTLTATNNGIGSAYLNLLSVTEILGIDLSGAGSLFLTQSVGDLTISGAINVTDGRAILTTGGELIVDASINTVDYLRIVANTLDVNTASLVATEGDVEIRVRGDADFASDSQITATLGDVNLTVGGQLDVADIDAGDDVNLRARGDILRNGGEIAGDALKISSLNGQIGASELDPIMTSVNRIDASAAGEIFISEADGVEFGRSGLANGGENPGDTVRISVGTGVISSTTGNVNFTGQGTFLIESTGNLTLATGITATNGNIAIVTGTLADGTATEDILLEARNGRVSITATNGIGGTGNLDVEIASSELTATTINGNLALELEATTTVVGNGVTVSNGSGSLILNQTTGSLFVNANIAHFGSGALDLDTVGSITMNTAGRVITNSGAMDILASGDINISQVRTTSGTVSLESVNGSIDKISGFSLPNIVSVIRPEVSVDDLVDVVINSDSVLVNGTFTIFRSVDQDFIVLALNFS